jgi:hypothetical protein
VILETQSRAPRAAEVAYARDTASPSTAKVLLAESRIGDSARRTGAFRLVLTITATGELLPFC